MSTLKFVEVCFSEMMIEDLFTAAAGEPDQKDLDKFNISISDYYDGLDTAIKMRRNANATRHS